MFVRNWGENWSTVKKLLKTHRLDYDMYDGEFLDNARVGVEFRNPETGQLDCYEGEPIHPNSPNAKRLMGNFEDIAASFSFDTDEPKKIAEFKKLIEQNRKLFT